MRYFFKQASRSCSFLIAPFSDDGYLDGFYGGATGGMSFTKHFNCFKFDLIYYLLFVLSYL